MLQCVSGCRMNNEEKPQKGDPLIMKGFAFQYSQAMFYTILSRG